MLFKKKKLIFNLHLILGFLACLPLIIIAVTGSMISYNNEIRNTINSLSFKADFNQIHTIAKTTQMFKNNYPNLEINSIKFEIQNPNLLTITTHKDQTNYLISRSDGAILGTDLGAKVMQIALALHRNLGLSLINSSFDGRIIGKHIVGVCSICLIVLCLSGLYLYAPRLKYAFFRSLKPNFKLKKYQFFYNFHSVFGVWSFAILILISLTGLFWSYAWVNSLFHKAFGIEQVQRDSKMRTKQTQKTAQAKFDQTSLEVVLATFEQNVKPGFQKQTIKQTSPNIYEIAYQNDLDTRVSNSVAINASTGEILNHQLAKISPQRALSLTILDLHSGKFFGKIGLFIFCIVSLLAALFAISGVIMSYFRLSKKPKIGKHTKKI
ncbi:putative iron-regulated membrane protein [Campylobacter iguaniorum]|uniref:Putative iron-regulated membrane protein n=1 Tax=Campylobacter iguaniorum TaxID=1244531 RepID=A0A076FDC9_9BACT|nr:PepSY-associated TM helix domain-containing protein [Campylobacter iguaniorum]AII15377.1 putative iron-regulated membrane protein [Campylobacter iguaniorum]